MDAPPYCAARSSFTVKFRESRLATSDEAKNLGLTFDKYLSWDSHVAQLSRKCVGILTGIAHLRHHLPSNVLTSIVTALVLSHVRYCLTVYGNGSGKNLDIVDKILNFAARVISGKRKFDHISGVRERLGWLSPVDMCTH